MESPGGRLRPAEAERPHAARPSLALKTKKLHRVGGTLRATHPENVVGYFVATKWMRRFFCQHVSSCSSQTGLSLP